MNSKLLLSMLLLSTLVKAQELPPVPEFKLEPIPPGPDVIEGIKKGQTAPFDGLLFSPATALRYGNYVKQAQTQVLLCRKGWLETQNAERAYWQGRLAVETEAADAIKVDLQQRVARLEERNTKLEGQLAKGPPWYNTRTFGVVVGVVGTSALVVTGAVVATSIH